MFKIFYWMHEATRASGGDKHSYEHVDILNAAGFEAYAVHLVGERHRWFDNGTRVIGGAQFWEMFDRQRDYMTVPETLGPFIAALPGRKVIFNKNLYFGFRTFPLQDSIAARIYTGDDVVAILTVSDHNYRHLRFAFPNALVKRVYAGIDPQRYGYRRMDQKKKQVAIVHKNPEEMGVLFQLLRARADAGINRLHDYQVRFLQGLSAADAAGVMQDAPLLVSLSINEGLPRTILEAMACGCIIAACGAGPLKEILPPPYGFEPGDLVGMAAHIESVLADFPDRLDRWAPTIEIGRQTAAAFSPARQRDVVVDVWREILATTAVDAVV
jgi:glycosyltransferase involved in cell wall biosynthesis